MEENENHSTRAYKKLYQAGEERQLAKINRRMYGPYGGVIEDGHADDLEVEAKALLNPELPPEIATGEAVPTEYDCKGVEENQNLYIRNTLNDDPNQITFDASHSRMKLAAETQCLDMAIDASHSIDARNSLEKMLAHQMAACHDKAMKIMGKLDVEIQQVDGFPRQSPDAVELQRMGNTAVRLMKCFQDGMLTIQKIRTGGKQIIQHQYVNVNNGGQAVVAANMKTGGQNTGGNNEK
jgi:hypothetical protein